MKKQKRTNYKAGDKVLVKSNETYEAEFVSELANDRCKIKRMGMIHEVPDSCIFDIGRRLSDG